MRKLTLRSEHLGELTTEQLRKVAGAMPEQRTVSDGSCICTINLPALVAGSCDVSDGSCGCPTCPQTVN